MFRPEERNGRGHPRLYGPDKLILMRVQHNCAWTIGLFGTKQILVGVKNYTGQDVRTHTMAQIVGERSWKKQEKKKD